MASANEVRLQCWWQKEASSMSRWQFRKFARFKARLAAMGVPSAFVQQVKSLGSADYATNTAAGTGSMAETQRADKHVQSELGIDIRMPNFLPFFNPFETTDVAVQTAAAVPEPGGSTSTRARRETRMDRMINEFHRGALYVEQDIRYLEHKYQDEELVQELRETFEEWDARMKPFGFITSYDSSTQTGMVTLAEDAARLLESHGDVSPGIDTTSASIPAAGAWRGLERHEVKAGLRVRAMPASSKEPSCPGRICDAYWACSDFMSGEVSYVCCVAFSDGCTTELSFRDLQIWDSNATDRHPT